MRSVVITGCSRGLGLGLVRNLVGRAGAPQVVIGTYRDLDRAQELKAVAEQHKNLHLLHLDVNNFDGYEMFREEIAKIVKDDGLNVLINNAGISPKFTRLNYVKAEQLLNTFTTNTVAPIMLAKALLPLLLKAARNNNSSGLSSSKAAIVNMTSMLGSMDLNTTGGLYPYRCSKAALNMATKTMSVDLQKDGILAMCLHPGWVKTDMGGANAPLDIDNSTKQIINLLYALNDGHNGGFYQYDGAPMKW